MMIDNLEAICHISKLSFWKLDLATNHFEENGYFGAFSGPFQDYLKKVYLPDRNNLENNFNQFAKNRILFETQFRIYRDNDMLKWVFIRGKMNDNSNIMSGVIIGVNDWKQNEENYHFNQLQLIEFMKESSCNGVISLLAHELTQPLTIINTYISGCIYRLKENRIDNQQLIDVMTHIKHQVGFIGNKIHELKSFSNDSQLQYSDTNIYEIIQETVFLLSYELKTQNIQMRCEFQENLPSVKIDKIKIKQVIYNLIKHSIENMENDVKSLLIDTKKINAQTIQISIEDNNSAWNLSKNNAPSNNTYQDLKVGLSACHTIIEAHGGTLSTSSSQKGNNYQFTLHS